MAISNGKNLHKCIQIYPKCPKFCQMWSCCVGVFGCSVLPLPTSAYPHSKRSLAWTYFYNRLSKQMPFEQKSRLWSLTSQNIWEKFGPIKWRVKNWPLLSREAQIWVPYTFVSCLLGSMHIIEHFSSFELPLLSWQKAVWLDCDKIQHFGKL